MLCKDNYNFYYSANPKNIESDYQEASNFIKYHFENSDNYDEEVIEAIKYYTGKEYRKLNQKLRENKCLNDKQLKNCQILINAISKSETIENFIVFRGVVLSKKEMKKMNLLTKRNKINNGGTYIEKGFSSTSLNKSVAKHFVENKINKIPNILKRRKKVIFIIRIAKGKAILPIANDSLYSKEKEFLLSCNSSFKILGGKIKRNSYHFVLEV